MPIWPERMFDQRQARLGRFVAVCTTRLLEHWFRRETTSMNVIGISAFFHDSACCLLQDGELTAAAEEERFSRIKHDPALPVKAFRFCLDQAGLALPDIDYIAYYEDPAKKAERQLWMVLPNLGLDPDLIRRIDPQRPMTEIRRLLGYEGPVEYVDHHYSHAASSFYFSGFSDAAIMTVDGVGEWATTAYGFAHETDIDIFEEVRFPNSVGLLYSTITSYLGFDVNDGEYKVMGLAPYGDPCYVSEMRKLIHFLPGGQYELDLQYFDFLQNQRMYSDRLVSLLGQRARQPESDLLPFHANVARSLQFILEELLLEKARYLHARTGSKNLCMAGGVALNCVANSRILRDGPFEKMFIQPAASDAGGAIGAASTTYVRHSGCPPTPRLLRHVYLGPSFATREIRALLDAAEVQVLDFAGKEPELLQAAVSRLIEGKVIGWFHGRMEFGPRSLGARSILADPRRPEMRDRINALVKQREAFRPFAPAVLESHCREHFDLTHSSPFMLETCQVTSTLDLPAITHVDRSARVQTVDSEASPRFARLLEEFERRSGCPLLLNTSFNIRGEPIVCTPTDALLCFVKCGIDSLVLEDFVLDRSAIGCQWRELIVNLNRIRTPGVSHTVYTLM